MKKIISLQIALATIVILIAFMPPARAQEKEDKGNEKAVPVFTDGEAQIVSAFNDPDKWIRHDLWVETEFDTDGDNKPDRMHVGVTRPYQTDTEGLKPSKGMGRNHKSTRIIYFITELLNRQQLFNVFIKPENQDISLIGGKLVSPKNSDVSFLCQFSCILERPYHLMFSETNSIQLQAFSLFD